MAKATKRWFFSKGPGILKKLRRRGGFWGHGLGLGIKKLVQWGLWFHAWYIPYILLLTLLFTHMTPAVSALMVYRKFIDGHKVGQVYYLPMESIPKNTPGYYITLEDHNFRSHIGIHIGAIREAMERNVARGELVFGASTISQQLVKNMFLVPDRNIIRKYLEMLMVVPVDYILGKDRILELYLNFIEFGKGVFGLEAAARYHYGFTYSKLSVDQRKRLAALIVSPLRYTVKTMMSRNVMVLRYRALTR